MLDCGREGEEARLEFRGEGLEGGALAFVGCAAGGTVRWFCYFVCGGGAADVFDGGFDVFAAELGEDVYAVGGWTVGEFDGFLLCWLAGFGVVVVCFVFGFEVFGDGGEGGDVG